MLRKKNRPKRNLPHSSFMTILETAAALVLLFSILLPVFFWSSIPERIPTHFNLIGQPDGWGNKSSFVFLCVFNLVLYFVMTFAARVPEIGNYPWEITEENAERQYHLVRLFISGLKLEIMTIFTYIELMTVQVGLGHASWGAIWFFPCMMGVIFATIIVYMISGWRAR